MRANRRIDICDELLSARSPGDVDAEAIQYQWEYDPAAEDLECYWEWIEEQEGIFERERESRTERSLRGWKAERLGTHGFDE